MALKAETRTSGCILNPIFFSTSIVWTNLWFRYHSLFEVLSSIKTVTRKSPILRLKRNISSRSWFQTFALFWMLYAFFWLIPRRLNFICWRFGALSVPWNTQSVPKRWHIKFRRQGVTQKKAQNFKLYFITIQTYRILYPHCCTVHFV